jgi:hypothetical protein
MQRLGGIISVKVDGKIYQAKGAFTYNPGIPLRTPIMGSDSQHGFKEEPQPGFIEGEFTDSNTLDVPNLLKLQNVTVTIELANGKMFVLRNAYYAGEGTTSTDEGNIGVRFEGRGEEVS